jgi:hypothetical protein
MDIYQSNTQNYATRILALEQDLKLLSALRLVTFMLSAIIIVILANERLLAPLLIVVPFCILGFGLLVNRYNRVDKLKRHTGFLKDLNNHEVLRQKNRLSDFAAGDEFAERDHPYASDLDIFGQHSLFQLLNRTTTETGQTRLAEWLSAPATKPVILMRQNAVKELSPKLEWRQNFQAAGMHFRYAKNDYTKLLAWIEKPVQLLPHQLKYLLVIIPLSILSTGAAVYFFIQFLLLGNFAGVIPVMIMGLINALVLRKVRSVAEDITQSIREKVKILNAYQSLVLKIEVEKFQDELLQRLQWDLRQDGLSAASKIGELRTVLETFQLRGRKREFNHFFYSVFNVLWFLDVYLIILTEKWKSTNGLRLRAWAATVDEFEALNSLAGFHHSNPSFIFPEIKDEPYTVHFESLGHPLISQRKRMCNHFTLKGRGEIAMITGSNMAGKTTFLRTLGVNLVLALMGAPCCARSAQVSHMKIFSSMRTQDNLEAGVSSFYAELKRVEQLLKQIESGAPIFFLLDEMFKGTNSKDRHKGGFSLIKQLRELNAFGIISTHDLELAELAGKHLIVTNYSFNSDIQEGEMIFSYKLMDGLCKDFNASELMKKSGIKILSYIEETL